MSPRANPGAGPASRISRGQILEAAERFYLHGHIQADIASDLGVSASYLARLLRQAREAGWVRIFVESDRETELAAALHNRYPLLAKVEVVQSCRDFRDTAAVLAKEAAHWLDHLLDDDQAARDPKIQRIAVGGSMVHQHLVERVGRRANRISVGPTALTPTPARVERFTSPIVAARLADRLGALSPGSPDPSGAERQGYLFCPTFKPPSDNAEALRRFFAELQTDPEYLEMLRFWKQVDVAFVSAVSVEARYDDVQGRLRNLGVSNQELIDKGATALFVNQYLNEQGDLVPILEGIPSYEVAMPLETLRAIAERRPGRHQRPGYVVMDAWGERGVGARAALANGLCNVLFADTVAASKLLE